MNAIQIQLDVPSTMSDGTVLRADVYTPGRTSEAGPWPVLLMRTPYNKRNSFYANLIFDSLTAVTRGYIVVIQDVRGRFASEGEWSPFEFERTDGFDTVAWCASLPGSSGVVGMFGGSYLGSAQWSAAIAGAPKLGAIAPQITWSDPLDGLYQRGGAIELGLNGSWSLFTGLSHVPRMHPAEAVPAETVALVADSDRLGVHGYWELPAGQLPAISRFGGPEIGTQRALGDPGTVEHNLVVNHYGNLRVPALNVAGWYDLFVQGTLDNYTAMAADGVPSRLIVGPWHHETAFGLANGQTGEINYGLSSSPGFIDGAHSLTSLQLEWFDHWLKKRDTGMLAEAPVKIFVMGANVWRDEAEWPLSRAVDTPWYLNAGSGFGLMAPKGEGYDTYTYDPEDPVITRGGAFTMSSDFSPGPFDQRDVEARDDVLVYTSEPLKEDLEVTGRVRAILFAATDAPSTDWVVRLCDVDENGVSRNVTDGVLRVSAQTGASGEHEIDLWSTSNVFLAGHRIRIQVTSSNFPRWDRNTNTGEPVHEARATRIAHQKVFHGGLRASHVVLPVVPPEA